MRRKYHCMGISGEPADAMDGARIAARLEALWAIAQAPGGGADRPRTPPRRPRPCASSRAGRDEAGLPVDAQPPREPLGAADRRRPGRHLRLARRHRPGGRPRRRRARDRARPRGRARAARPRRPADLRRRGGAALRRGDRRLAADGRARSPRTRSTTCATPRRRDRGRGPGRVTRPGPRPRSRPRRRAGPRARPRRASRPSAASRPSPPRTAAPPRRRRSAGPRGRGERERRLEREHRPERAVRHRPPAGTVSTRPTGRPPPRRRRPGSAHRFPCGVERRRAGRLVAPSPPPRRIARGLLAEYAGRSGAAAGGLGDRPQIARAARAIARRPSRSAGSPEYPHAAVLLRHGTGMVPSHLPVTLLSHARESSRIGGAQVLAPPRRAARRPLAVRRASARRARRSAATCPPAPPTG